MDHTQIGESIAKKIGQLKGKEEELLKDITELYKLEKKYHTSTTSRIKYKIQDGGIVEIRKEKDAKSQLEEIVIIYDEEKSMITSYAPYIFGKPIMLEKFVATIKDPLHKKIKLTIDVIQQTYKPYLAALEEIKKQLEQEITQYETTI